MREVTGLGQEEEARRAVRTAQTRASEQKSLPPPPEWLRKKRQRDSKAKTMREKEFKENKKRIQRLVDEQVRTQRSSLWALFGCGDDPNQAECLAPKGRGIAKHTRKAKRKPTRKVKRKPTRKTKSKTKHRK